MFPKCSSISRFVRTCCPRPVGGGSSHNCTSCAAFAGVFAYSSVSVKAKHIMREIPTMGLWIKDPSYYCYHYGVPSATAHKNGPDLPLPGPDVGVDLPECPRNAVYIDKKRKCLGRGKKTPLCCFVQGSRVCALCSCTSILDSLCSTRVSD